MKYIIYTVLVLLSFSLSCSFEELPGQKRLRTCQKPNATITATPDAANYLRYTLGLSNISGDVESVDWQIGNSLETHLPAEKLTSVFAQSGTYTVKATLKNACNENTTVQLSFTVSASAPIVTFVGVDSIKQNAAFVRMSIAQIGSGASLSEFGIVYGEIPNPTRQNGQFVVGAGSPTLNTPIRFTLSNLIPGKKYYVNAYARNSAGIDAYGTAQEFTTLAVPVINTWVRTLGGSNADYGYVILAAPGGYLMIGNSASTNGDVSGNRGSYDAWVAKLDLSGTIIWQKTLGGSGDDVLWAGQVSTDGTYILAGTTSSSNGDIGSNGGGYDSWLVRINAEGAILWSKTYGGIDTEKAFGVYALSNGNYVFTSIVEQANGNSSAVINLVASNGTLTKSSVTSEGKDRRYYNIRPATGGGYMAIGSAGVNAGLSTYGNIDMLFTQYNDNLGQVQNVTIGDKYDDGGKYVLPVSGGYVVVGTTGVGSSGVANMLVTKRDANGGEIWKKNYGGSKVDAGEAVVATSDGGYLIVGMTESNDGDVADNHGGADLWLVKLKGDGSMDWQRAIGGSGNDYGYDILSTADGGFIVVGNSTSANGNVITNRGNTDVLVIKVDSNGQIKN